MSWVALQRRSARWISWSLVALVAVVPVPAAAFAFADGWEGPACTFSAWSFVSTGPLVTGGPYDPTPVVRYSNRCAMRTTGPGFVQSDHPASEVVYRARFHVFPQTSGGAVVVFQGTDSSGVPQFSIAHDPVADAFLVYIGSTSAGAPDTTSGPAPEFRWYSVEVHYQAGQKLAVTVQGAGVPTPSTVNSLASVAASSIDSARLGWLGTANGNPTGAINFDAFESNNLATPIGPACRADSDGDGFVGPNDYIVLTEEILRRKDVNGDPKIAIGQPDCTEDGKLDAFDRVCVAKLGGNCP